MPRITGIPFRPSLPAAPARATLGAWAAVALGAGLRLAVVVQHRPTAHLFSDMGGYHRRAVTLVTGAPLDQSDAFFPAGTHLLASLPLALFGTGTRGALALDIWWFLLSAPAPLLAWLWLRRHLPPWAAATGAAIVACWPLAVGYTGFLLSEAPATSGLLLMLWLADRVADTDRRARAGAAVTAGVVAGLVLAVRPQLVLNVAIAALGVVAALRTHVSFRALCGAALAACIGLLGVVTPVMALNRAAAGETVGLATNGGLNFYLGHCDVRLVHAYDDLGGAKYGSPVAAQLDRGHRFTFAGRRVWDESFFYGQGWACVRGDGWMHARRLLRNLRDAGSTSVPWPLSVSSSWRSSIDWANRGYATLVPIAVVAAAATAIASPRRSRTMTFALVCAAHLTTVGVVAVVYFGDPRFRSPTDPIGIALVFALSVMASERTSANSAESANFRHARPKHGRWGDTCQ